MYHCFIWQDNSAQKSPKTCHNGDIPLYHQKDYAVTSFYYRQNPKTMPPLLKMMPPGYRRQYKLYCHEEINPDNPITINY